jgi:hypothetical protein
MSPELLPRLLAALRPAHPEVAEWLASQGPVGDPASWIRRLGREGLRATRAGRRRSYYARHGFTKRTQAVR